MSILLINILYDTERMLFHENDLNALKYFDQLLLDQRKIYLNVESSVDSIVFSYQRADTCSDIESKSVV